MDFAPRYSAPCSCPTCAKNPHDMQSRRPAASVPQISPRANDPAIAQQARPPFFPPLNPCARRAEAAGHTP